jgi:hypothetical protein
LWLPLLHSPRSPWITLSPNGARAGVLTCDISAGIRIIIGSQKIVSCVYASERTGPQQAYSGSISKFGLDIGATSRGVMVWGVFTDSVGPDAGFLAGHYFARAAR